MARILVIGAAGLLGREVVRAALDRGHDVISAGRTPRPGRLRFDAETDRTELLFASTPDIVVNCAAVLGSEIDPGDPESVTRAERVNARFPHALADVAEEKGAHLIHISTDAVFREDAGVCREDDDAFATDVYGSTKRRGEPSSDNALSVRCSFVGIDPERRRGLLEWLLAQPPGAEVAGFADQLWNGLASPQVAAVCMFLADDEVFARARAEGPVHHLFASPTLTKHELVELCVKTFGLPVTVVPRPSARPSTRLLGTVRTILGECLESVPPRARSLELLATRELLPDD